MNENVETIGNVSVIGLGQMGATLARLLLQKGYRVTVWNRTASKAGPLIGQGAVEAKDVAEAIRASSVIVICVFDYKASAAILDKPEITSLLSGKTLIQLTTGSPADASESELWATGYGAKYLDGAIQVAPEQMARPDTTIFISGSETTFSGCEELLKVFGGNIKYLGNKVRAASAMDLVSLSYFYSGMLGFFHAVRIAEAEGFAIDLVGDVVSEVSPGLTEFLEYEAAVIQSGDFRITQSPLSISVEATERILNLSREYGINTEVPALIADFLKRGKNAGLENKELASLIQVFR